MFTLQEAMKALEGRKEFIIKKLDGHTIINYYLALSDSFEGIRENFRGIVFNDTTGEIVSLPLHKFYNVGQKEHTSLDKIKDILFKVYEKYDGSMCHGLLVNDKVMLSTRMGWDTPQAIAATELLYKNNWAETTRKAILDGYTPIFEYIGPSNAIVVRYEQDELVPLVLRDRVSGGYQHFLDIRNDKVSVIYTTIDTVMKEAESLENKEGFVCVSVGGDLWVKVKSPWYNKFHHSVNMMMKPLYHLYEVALNGEMDDLIASSPDLYKQSLTAIQDEVVKDQLSLKDFLEKASECLQKDVEANNPFVLAQMAIGRKEYAGLAQNQYPEHFSALMRLFSGKTLDVENYIKKYLYNKYKTEKKGFINPNLEG